MCFNKKIFKESKTNDNLENSVIRVLSSFFLFLQC